MPAFEDLEGRRFGKLFVMHRTARTPGVWWMCICDCSNPKMVRAISLKSGGTRSCGCLAREHGARLGAAHKQHGESVRPTPEYRAWKLMRDRCSNPKNRQYKDYGGRGITVCAHWMKFENFLADMKRKPSDDHSLERKKNHLGYTPTNCVWATSAAQNANKRSNVRITHKGMTLHLAEWARRLGKDAETLRYRLKHWPKRRVFAELDSVQA